MRGTLLLPTFFILILSCNNAGKGEGAGDTTIIKQQPDTTILKTERQILLEELRRLDAVLASGDKEKIADIFNFPLSDDSLGIFIDDSTFNAQLEKNGNQLTRSMFIKYYGHISENLQIEQVTQLFRKINIDKLLYQDKLDQETIIEAEPCYHYYGIETVDSRVILTIGTNSNRDFKNEPTSEDKIPQNSSEICEHVLWWNFTFDGKQLHFAKITGAG